jgi:MATE family multidrug resistance protein
MVLMSGLLPEPQVSVSVMGLCIQTSGLCYMIVTGLACAASVRVSNSLGARLPDAARRATWTAWGLTMALQACVGVGILGVRNLWPRIFTTSEAVVQRTAHLLPLFALRWVGGDRVCVCVWGGGGERCVGVGVCDAWVWGGGRGGGGGLS